MARKLVAIVGATATGKTGLAIELARRFGGEIVGADSRQVYRRMDIGTAKPTAAELAAAAHHLVNVVDPDEQFSLGRWLELARQTLEDIWSRGQLPLVVGGTGQYIWALLEGWRVPRVPPQEALRRELETRPPEDLLSQLRQVDPEAQEFIDPRNVRRVIRALEVHATTGRPFSYWRKADPPEFDAVVIGLHLDRGELYRRIDARVDAMMESGFLEEVRDLLDAGYTRDLAAMSGIGYREMNQHLAGELSLAEAVERTKTGTHRLARHQNSWFKATDDRIRWTRADDEGSVARAADMIEGLNRTRAQLR